MWDGITNPFPNFNGAIVEAWEWISNFTLHFIIDVTTAITVIKSIHINKRGMLLSNKMPQYNKKTGTKFG